MGAQQLLLRVRGPAVRLTSRSVSAVDSVTAPATASATAVYALLNTGVLRLNGVTDVAGEWRAPSGGSTANYEVRFTHLSGSVPTGAAYGSWLNLGTTRDLSLNATRATNGITTVTGTVRVEIGRAGFGAALVTADITLTAEAEREP